MDPKIRILHLIDSLDLGGAQESLGILVRYADHARFDVHVAALHGEGYHLQRLEKAGATVHSLASSRYDPLIAPRLFALLKRLRPRVLHTHLAFANCFGKLCGKLAGVEAMITHARSENPFRFQQRLLAPFDAWASRTGDAAIAVSQQVAEFLRDVQRVPAERVRLIPNAPNLPSLRQPSPEERRAFLARAGVPPGAYSAGCAARLDPNKGLLDLVQAARLLAEKMPELHLLIAGEGSQRAELERAKREAGLGERLHLLGYIAHEGDSGKDFATFIGSLDAYVLPSYYEGLPVSVLEAMALGVPVIATRVSGLEGSFTDRREIFFVPMRDARALAGALEELRGCDAPRIEALRNAAHDKVRQLYDPHRTARSVEALYLEVLDSATHLQTAPPG